MRFLMITLLGATALVAGRASTPVVVELFTSEGCSSCPPADALLQQLEEKQPVPGVEVIVLSEHVDYWNRLGWTDPFSSAEFSARQHRYAEAFRSGRVYTPQMIVDGHVEFVGSDARQARRAIEQAARAPKVPVSLERAEDPSGTTLWVRIDNPPAVTKDTVEVILALTESGLESDVHRGENTGRRLQHTAVVRRLTVLGSTNSAPFVTAAGLRLDSSWKRRNLRAVVFLQQRQSRRVLGAAALPL
jgi:hypothetical protein